MVLDLVEEFRPIIDGLVLRMINRRQLGPLDFQEQAAQSFESLLAESVGDQGSPISPEVPSAQHGGEPADENADEPPFDVMEEGDSSPTDEVGKGRPAVYLADSGRRFLERIFSQNARRDVLWAAGWETRDPPDSARESLSRGTSYSAERR